MGWAEIKKVINSDLTKPLNTLITEVKDTLNTALDTKASQTSVTAVQTTSNTINTNVNTLLSGRTVKSVQRGVITTVAGNVNNPKPLLLGISSINTAKSLVIVENFAPLTSNNHVSSTYAACGEIINSNTIGLYYPSDNAVTYKVLWQVIEFY